MFPIYSLLSDKLDIWGGSEWWMACTERSRSVDGESQMSAIGNDRP